MGFGCEKIFLSYIACLQVVMVMEENFFKKIFAGMENCVTFAVY